MVVQQRVHSVAKWMRRGDRQVGRRDPQVVLLLPLLSGARLVPIAMDVSIGTADRFWLMI
jgi:hypothetical protein